MKSKSFSLTPTTADQTQIVSYSRGGYIFKPSLYTIKNLTDKTVRIKLLSNDEADEIRDYPSEFSYFALVANKEYTLTHSKYFDYLIYKADSAIGSGTLEVSILDFEKLGN